MEGSDKLHPTKFNSGSHTELTYMVTKLGQYVNDSYFSIPIPKKWKNLLQAHKLLQDSIEQLAQNFYPNCFTSNGNLNV